MKVAIIGAGAAGLFAACKISEDGHEVFVFERNEICGKKLLATGNGRCNFTNEDIRLERFHGSNPKFAISALSKFGLNEILASFTELGMKYTKLSKGRYYPRSLESHAVLELLLLRAKQNKVQFKTSSKVVDIIKDEKPALVLEDGTIYHFDKIVIACGGATHKNSGSDGSGYELAKKIGHKIVKVGPAIVQMRLKGNLHKTMSGQRFTCLVKLLSDKKVVAEDEDEVLFTDYGISGPAILQLSGRALKLLDAGERAYFTLDLFPDMTLDELTVDFVTSFSISGEKTVKEALVSSIRLKLIDAITSTCLDGEILARDLDYKTILKLAETLKNWKFEIKDYYSFDSAQVSTGGVSTDEINPKTMESKLCKNIYFCGEVVDIDGDCGGFNLHWAWASASVTASGLGE